MRAFSLLHAGIVVVMLAVTDLAACAPPAPPNPDGGPDAAAMEAAVLRWNCPAEWVAAERGGCGPAVLLCGPSGGAAAGACAGVDVTRPRSLRLADGGTTSTFYLAPDGSVRGGWIEPGEPGGAPMTNWLPDLGRPATASDWAPVAGIPTCAPRWRALADGTCDPALRTDCPAGSAAVPGGGCTATAASDCPATEWPDPGAEAVGAAIVYVRAGADPSIADGSMAHPYAGLARAVAIATSGSWILLSDGRYPSAVTITNELHIVGRCAAGVTLVGTVATGPTLNVSGAAARLDVRAVHIEDGNHGIQVVDRAHASVRHVSIGHAHGSGIHASSGAVIDVDDLFVRESIFDADDRAGRGLSFNGGEGTLRHVVLADNHTEGILVSEGRLTLEDSVIRGTLARPAGPMMGLDGSGMWVQAASEATLARVVIAGNRLSGVGASGISTRVSITDSRIDDTAVALRPYNIGAGLLAEFGAALSVDRVAIVHSGSSGVFAERATTDVRVTNSVIRTTVLEPTAFGTGSGASAVLGAHLTVSHTVLDRNEGSGVASYGSGSDLVVTDCRLYGGSLGQGLVASAGSHATVSRTLFEDCAAGAVHAHDTGTLATLQDCVMRSTSAPLAEYERRGIEVAEGAHVEANRIRIAGAEAVAVLSIGRATNLHLSDSVVTGTVPGIREAGRQAGGRGLEATAGGSIDARRVLIENGNDYGAFVSSPESTLEMHASTVRRNGGFRGGGYGIWLQDGARAVVEGCVLERNTAVGAGAALGSTLTVRDTVVRGTRSVDGSFGLGLLVQTGAQFDASRVLIQDNRLMGAYAIGADAVLTLEDAIVSGVTPERRGYGIGVAALVEARVIARRLAITAVTGAAIMAAPHYVQDGTSMAAEASITADDLYIQRVGSSTIRIETDGRPTGRAVAYGLHAARGCSVTARRFVIDEAGYGFYNAGTMELAQGVVSRQLDAFGAQTANAMGQPVMSDVVSTQNAYAGIVMDLSLPEGSSLPPPLPVCPQQGCK